MDRLVLSTELVNGILQYLGTQPFANVAGLISAIQKEAGAQMPVQEPKTETEVEAPKE